MGYTCFGNCPRAASQFHPPFADYFTTNPTAQTSQPPSKNLPTSIQQSKQI